MRQDTARDYRARLEAVIELLVSRLDAPPSVAEMADISGFSRFHFGRIFGGALGESPGDFSRRIRLERAGYLLQNSKLNVSEVSLEAGYESLEAFSRAFRSVWKVNPSDYRPHDGRWVIQAASGIHWDPETGFRPRPLVLAPGKPMQATLTHEPLRHLLAMRHVGPYHEIAQTFEKLAAYVYAQGLAIGESLAVYYDDPGVTPAHELRSDASFLVGEDFELPAGHPGALHLTQIPAGEYITAAHIGSYDGLGDAWSRFMGDAAPALGRPIGHLTFEIYRGDCSGDPATWRTDLYVSVG
jgi:AraC family transcriptional regulator